MTTFYQVLSTSEDEPVSLEGQVKPYLRVTDAAEDDLIAGFMTQARQHIERVTRLALITQSIQAIIETARMRSGALSGPIGSPAEPFPITERAGSLGGMTQFYLKLPRSPAQSITTVEYQLTPFDAPEWTVLPAQDGSGKDNYRLDSVILPSRLYFAGLLSARRFRITYSAGCTAGSLPGDLEQILLQLVALFYLQRDDPSISVALDDALAPSIVRSL